MCFKLLLLTGALLFGLIASTANAQLEIFTVGTMPIRVPSQGSISKALVLSRQLEADRSSNPVNTRSAAIPVLTGTEMFQTLESFRIQLRRFGAPNTGYQTAEEVMT